MHDHLLTFHTDQVIKNIDEIAAVWNEYISSGALSPEEKILAGDFAAKREKFTKEGLLATRDAVLAGKFEEAISITLTKTNPLFKTANETVTILNEYEKKLA